MEKNDKLKLLAGILLFGSLWGFSECIIGSKLYELNLPAGAIMTAIFAMGFLTISRILYKQRGMQVGMGLVAGTLRLFNPFGACFLCSAIAIMAQGVLFELIWYKFSLDLKELKPIKYSASMGVVTAYVLYIGSYLITQILTPVFTSAGFYIENVVVFIPQILASGLLAALLGFITIPILFALSSVRISIPQRLYYPLTLGIALLCWIVVISNTVLILLG